MTTSHIDPPHDPHAAAWQIGLAPARVRPPLSGNHHVEVCVIGAGISGLTAAYRLLRQGRSVVVIDDRDVGAGETGRTSGHLASEVDEGYEDIERTHGGEGARVTAESHRAAIDFIESTCAIEGIDCEFARVEAVLFAGPEGSQEDLVNELAAAQRAGLTGAYRVDASALPDFATGAHLRFPDQAQFHPLRYVLGLADAVERLGGRIHGRTHAERITDGTPATVAIRGGGVITAEAVVVATNVPINDRVAMHTKLEAYRSYVIGLPIPRGSVPPALYWDTDEPYHYIRVVGGDGDEDLLIVGGEDHRTGQEDDPEARYRRLEEWTRPRFPRAGAVTWTWSGQVIEPVDGIAFIGRNPGDEHVYIITGDSGNGLTHGTLGALLIAELIAGREHPWAKLYAPGRVTMRTLGEYAKHNLNVAAQYRDWFANGDVPSIDRIERGSGAVVRSGLTRVAVHRDDDGACHACSAICPHLGGVVRWNPSERTWDCPCHGSRFDRSGRMLNGPANADLAPRAVPGGGG